MTRVTVPAGCTGLDFADGSRTPPIRQGSSIEVSDAHARHLHNSWYGQTGTITATGYSFGTRKGMRCPECGRTWQAWTTECHKCKVATQPV